MLCRKRLICHEFQLLQDSTSPMLLKVGREKDCGVIQKSNGAIFAICILRNFRGIKVQNLDLNTCLETYNRRYDLI